MIIDLYGCFSEEDELDFHRIKPNLDSIYSRQLFCHSDYIFLC